MTLTTELRKLYSVAPHFMDDKDEDWMTHLPLDKKTFIVDKRAEVLTISEQIESHTLAYRNLMASLRDATPERKAQAKKEFDDKKKSFEETRDEKIRDLLPALRRLKSRGLQLKEQIAQEAATNLNKRRRLQDIFDPSLEMDPNVELVTDDYLPSYINSYLPQQTSSNNHNKRRQKSARNEAEQVPDVLMKISPSKNRDTFFDGVDDTLDRKVLTDLRSEIIKYNCRDRVIKAIQSITLQDQRIEIMKKISQIVEMMKSSEDR